MRLLWHKSTQKPDLMTSFSSDGYICLYFFVNLIAQKRTHLKPNNYSLCTSAHGPNKRNHDNTPFWVSLLGKLSALELWRVIWQVSTAPSPQAEIAPAVSALVFFFVYFFFLYFLQRHPCALAETRCSSCYVFTMSTVQKWSMTLHGALSGALAVSNAN